MYVINLVKGQCTLYRPEYDFRNIQATKLKKSLTNLIFQRVSLPIVSFPYSTSLQVKIYVNICLGNLLCWKFGLCLNETDLEKYRLSNKMILFIVLQESIEKASFLGRYENFGSYLFNSIQFNSILFILEIK